MIRGWRKPGINNNLKYRRLRYEEDDDPGSDDGHDYLGPLGAAKNEALFLSDKMAYELNLTAAQYEAVYEINLDYLMSLNGNGDVFGIWWDRRNADLRYVLNSWQYDKYVALSHFYRPVAWKAGSWTFAVYTHYNRGHFYNDRPTVFVTYKGGHNRVHGSHYAHMHKPAVHHQQYITMLQQCTILHLLRITQRLL